MVALLAGTRTSPERVFPPVDPSLTLQNDPLEIRRRELSDRRAVTALLNALLSIAGAGVATWWAADRLGWRNEWVRLLFHLPPVTPRSASSLSVRVPPSRAAPRPRATPLCAPYVAPHPARPRPRLPAPPRCQRVLLALSVAIVVASSEAALYLIWEDRRAKPTSTSTSARASRHRPRHAAPELVSSDKKHEPASPDATHPDVQRTAVVSASSARVRGTADNALRERAGPSAEDRTARDH